MSEVLVLFRELGLPGLVQSCFQPSLEKEEDHQNNYKLVGVINNDIHNNKFPTNHRFLWKVRDSYPRNVFWNLDMLSSCKNKQCGIQLE